MFSTKSTKGRTDKDNTDYSADDDNKLERIQIHRVPKTQIILIQTTMSDTEILPNGCEIRVMWSPMRVALSNPQRNIVQMIDVTNLIELEAVKAQLRLLAAQS